MGALSLVLLLPSIKGRFGSGLFLVSTVAVIAIQLGLVVDIPTAALGNRLGARRVLCTGMALVAIVLLLVAAAGFATSSVALEVGAAGVAVGGWALTSVQNRVLAAYYPLARRSMVYFALRAGIVAGLALTPLIVGGLELFYDWEAPFVVLAGLMLVFVAAASALPRSPEGDDEPDAPPAEPPTFPESIRVLFARRSMRHLYYALPFLAVTALGLRSFTDLLYRNVFHQDAAARALIAAGVQPGAVVGLIVGFVVLRRRFAQRPGDAVRLLGLAAGVAAACLGGMAAAPTLAWAIAFQAAYVIVSSWLLAGVYATVSLVAPARYLTLAFALTSVWLGFGVGAIAPVGPSLLTNVDNTFGFRVGLLLVLALYVVGGAFLASAGSTLDTDVEGLRLTVAADDEVRRARLAGHASLLMVRALDAGYDGRPVLFDVDLDVADGELVAVLGTNGAGKTTLLRAISGLTAPTAGQVIFDGRDITSLDPNRITELGIVQVPGGRGIFADLTVAESFEVAGWRYSHEPAYLRDATEAALAHFPVLRERWHTAAGNLSGGEQQMLSLAQAFLARPRLLMIDELSLGLAPSVIEALLDIVEAIHRNGTTVLLVEQSVDLAVRLAARAIFMERGRVVFTGSTADLVRRGDLVRAVFLGGEAAAPSPRPGAATARSNGVALRASGLRRSFGGVAAVDDVDLELRSGEILGLMGPNGAGKTTVLEMLSGHLASDGGRVVLFGEDISHWPAHRRAAAGLGRSFQSARLWPGLTVQETLAVAVTPRVGSPGAVAALLCLPTVGRAERRVTGAVDEVVAQLGLDDYRDQLTADLSTGTRRLVELAVLVAMQPSVLLLDEPSAGVAQAESLAMAPMLRETRDSLDASVLIIEHDLALLRAVADRVVAMDAGRVLTVGAPDEVLEDPRVVASYLGTSDR
jgi:branched-chain amino acid transport system ATP-binding protein